MAPDPDQPARARQEGGGDLLERMVDGGIRLGRAWAELGRRRERRTAAVSVLVLVVTLFLPWYQDSVVRASGHARGPAAVGQTLDGWAAFGVPEAGILIVSCALLALLFLWAEGRGALVGADGAVVTAAGLLALALVVWGALDVPSPSHQAQYVVSTGLEWGIFLAFFAAGTLTWAGGRLRHRGDPRPSRELEDGVVFDGRWQEAPAPSVTPKAPGAANAADTAATKVVSASAADPPGDRDTGSARSRWRPAERPNWSEAERPTGWLTAPPKHAQER